MNHFKTKTTRLLLRNAYKSTYSWQLTLVQSTLSTIIHLSYFWRLMSKYCAIIGLLLFVASCRPPVFPPKPPGYFRIDTPALHQYRVFDQPGFPYTFEYPIYANIERDTVFMGKKTENPFWINMFFPTFNGVINITYKDITPQQTLDKLNEDAWGLSFFHHEKASGIVTREFSNGMGVSGALYIVDGNTASRYQFTATDSSRHFLRGALYFDVTPNADSLMPASVFLQKDIEHLLMTLKWK